MPLLAVQSHTSKARPRRAGNRRSSMVAGARRSVARQRKRIRPRANSDHHTLAGQCSTKHACNKHLATAIRALPSKETMPVSPGANVPDEKMTVPDSRTTGLLMPYSGSVTCQGAEVATKQSKHAPTQACLCSGAHRHSDSRGDKVLARALSLRCPCVALVVVQQGQEQHALPAQTCASQDQSMGLVPNMCP